MEQYLILSTILLFIGLFGVVLNRKNNFYFEMGQCLSMLELVWTFRAFVVLLVFFMLFGDLGVSTLMVEQSQIIVVPQFVIEGLVENLLKLDETMCTSPCTYNITPAAGEIPKVEHEFNLLREILALNPDKEVKIDIIRNDFGSFIASKLEGGFASVETIGWHDLCSDYIKSIVEGKR